MPSFTRIPKQPVKFAAPSSSQSGEVTPAPAMDFRGPPPFAARQSMPDKIIVAGGFQPMSLNETTRKVLRLVEERSGIPVHVEPDPNLPGTLLAKVTMARGKVALHRVVYRPNSATPPDYLICQQAGFILRLFATPPESRKDFAGTAAANVAVERLVKEHPVAQLLPAGALPQFVQLLRDGLLHHLRSIPISMRVDRWLASEFPELRELQRQAVLQQVQDAALTLAPQHRQSTRLRRAQFCLDGVDGLFHGWTTGESWNGWAKPMFESQEARRVIAAMPELKGKFNASADRFVTLGQDGEEESWSAESVQRDGGSTVKVYPVGAGCWCWDETPDS